MRFAEILDRRVVRITVSVDESIGADWLNENVGGVWVSVSDGIVVGPGYTYDPDRDAFIPPQPYPSWTLNETTFSWEAPVPYPTDGEYVWNENRKEWEPVMGPTE